MVDKWYTFCKKKSQMHLATHPTSNNVTAAVCCFVGKIIPCDGSVVSAGWTEKERERQTERRRDR